MTSNLGAQYLLEGIDKNGAISERATKQVDQELKGHFRPEFLNRVDDVILFKPLTQSEVENIVELLIDGLKQRLAERQIKLELKPEAKAFIARSAYDPVYGARPLKRYIQRELETQLGRQLIAGSVTEGSRLIVDVVNGALNVSADQSL